MHVRWSLFGVQKYPSIQGSAVWLLGLLSLSFSTVGALLVLDGPGCNPVHPVALDDVVWMGGGMGYHTEAAARAHHPHFHPLPPHPRSHRSTPPSPHNLPTSHLSPAVWAPRPKPLPSVWCPPSGVLMTVSSVLCQWQYLCPVLEPVPPQSPLLFPRK